MLLPTRKRTQVTRGLVGWWPLDGAGFWRDDSGYAHPVFRVGNPYPVASKFPGRTAMQATTAADYMHSSAFPWAGGPTTVLFWVRSPASFPPSGSEFAIGGAPARFQAHCPYSNNTLYWDYGNTTTGRLTTDFTTYGGKWTHAALWSNAVNSMGIALNGVVVATGASAADTGAVSPGIDIGAWGAQTLYSANATLDFRVYNRVLSLAEINQIYAETLNPPVSLDLMATPAAGGTPSLSLATTEATDTAAFTVGLVDSAALATTEATDTASFNLGANDNASLATTEATDTAAFNVSVIDTVSLATTEAQDVATCAISIARASFALTESPDSPAFVASDAVPLAVNNGYIIFLN